MNIGKEILRPSIRPLLQGTVFRKRGLLNPTVDAYRIATGISNGAALQVNALLAQLTAAAGVAPVFLWVGGSDYNVGNNLKTVIGGDLTLQGGNATAPTINAKSLRTTRGTKFLRGANPTSGDAKWTWATWFEQKDTIQEHTILALRNAGTTEKGPSLRLIPSSLSTVVESSSAGTSNNANVNPVAPGARMLIGPTFGGVTYDPSDSPAPTLRAFFNATFEPRSLTVYNAHQYLRIGGIDDAASGSFPWLLSNAEFYAVAGFETDLTEAQFAAVRIALYNSGVQAKHSTVPAMVYLGDSTMAARWNTQIHSGDQGGAWRDRVAMGHPIGAPPFDMGGKAFNWHFALKAAVIETLNSLPYEDRYFVYVAETPSGMTGGESFWDEIGVDFNDVPGFYAKMEEWLLEIQAATGCEVILCSYLQGVGNPSAEADRNYAQAIASDNGFAFVDFWNEPHSRVNTNAYGFYADAIHQTTAGCNVQAEFITAILPHPNMPDAPRFNVAAPPAITGTPTSGQVLACSVGAPHVAGTSYTYQWLRNLANISGATSANYTLQAADVGNRVACRVTAVKAGQPSASFTAAPTVVIA